MLSSYAYAVTQTFPAYVNHIRRERRRHSTVRVFRPIKRGAPGGTPPDHRPSTEPETETEKQKTETQTNGLSGRNTVVAKTYPFDLHFFGLQCV